jgi:hypothetical protein
MKAHLKTIGILIAMVLFVYIGFLFPKVIAALGGLISLAAVYLLVYIHVKDNGDNDDELLGPFNAGGRERD